jgi:hypothetical protein
MKLHLICNAMTDIYGTRLFTNSIQLELRESFNEQLICDATYDPETDEIIDFELVEGDFDLHDVSSYDCADKREQSVMDRMLEMVREGVDID